MGTDAFGYLLAAIALVLTIVAWNRRNFLLSVVTAGAWLGSWMYIRDNMPGGAVIDDNLQNILWVVVIGVMIAVLIRAIPEVRARRKDDVVPDYDEGRYGGLKGFFRKLNGDDVPSRPTSRRQRELDNIEYRKTVHNAVSPRARLANKRNAQGRRY